MTRIPIPLTIALTLLTGGCRLYGDPCQQQIDACLTRCEHAHDGDDSANQDARPPNDTRDACERGCQRCRGGSNTTQPPKATPTGT